MPARIATTLTVKKEPGLPLFSASLLCSYSFRLPAPLDRPLLIAGLGRLPVDEYRTLHARAYPSSAIRAASGGSTLTRVDYDLRIDGELASGRAILTVDVLKDGWARVRCPRVCSFVRRGWTATGFSSSRRRRQAAGQLSALLSHSGRAVLLLDIALPVTSATGEESITLPSTASGVTRASVQLPRRAWTSGSQVASSLTSPNPPRKASGLLTDAATKHSSSLGAGRPRIIAPLSAAHARIAHSASGAWRRFDLHQRRSKSRGNSGRGARRKNSSS